MKRIIFVLVTLLFGLQAMAASKILGGPTPGLWWNANESGRGYQVDLQGSIMVVTTYAYGPTGAVVWYVSAGVYNHTTGTFEATFDNGENGQCFGCVYRAPTPRPSAGGQMRIVFSDANNGVLYFNGGSTPIRRDTFGYPAKLDFLYGEFVFSTNTNGTIVADWPIMVNAVTNNRRQYVTGNEDSSSDIVVGTYDASSGHWLILVSAGAYDHYYEVFQMDDRRMLAAGWIVPAGATPSGGGVAAIGTRVLMKDEITRTTLTANRGVAPARKTAGNRAENGADSAAYEMQMAAARGEAAPAHIVEFAQAVREVRGVVAD